MVLAQIKSNLAIKSPAITYRIESSSIVTDEDDVIEVPTIKFGQEIDVTADQLLGKHDSRKDAPAREACWADMQDLFAEQQVWEVEEIKKKLRQAGHSESTIRRTADAYVIKTKHAGQDGRIDHWTWSLQLSGSQLERWLNRGHPGATG